MSETFKQYNLSEPRQGEATTEGGEQPIPKGLIDVRGRNILRAGTLESGNFRTGQQGWSFNSEGDVEIRNFTHDLVIYKNGTTTRDNTAASGSQTIAHGLGKTPSYVRITAKYVVATNASTEVNSVGVYNGSTTSTISMGGSVSGGDIETNSSSTNIIFILEAAAGPVRQVATVSFDATNINLVWTRSGTPSGGNIQILWEAFAD